MKGCSFTYKDIFANVSGTWHFLTSTSALSDYMSLRHGSDYLTFKLRNAEILFNIHLGWGRHYTDATNVTMANMHVTSFLKNRHSVEHFEKIVTFFLCNRRNLLKKEVLFDKMSPIFGLACKFLLQVYALVIHWLLTSYMRLLCPRRYNSL